MVSQTWMELQNVLSSDTKGTQKMLKLIILEKRIPFYVQCSVDWARYHMQSKDV